MCFPVGLAYVPFGLSEMSEETRLYCKIKQVESNSLKVTSNTKLLKLCHLRYRSRFFHFAEKLCSVRKILKIFCIFKNLIIYQICDIMMSLSTETGCIFEYIF